MCQEELLTYSQRGDEDLAPAEWSERGACNRPPAWFQTLHLSHSLDLSREKNSPKNKSKAMAVYTD